MGSKTTKTQQTNRPIYASNIEGAANTLQNTYAAQAPKIGAISDQFLGASGDLLGRAMAGNPAVNSARDYIASTLGRNPGSNPELENIISRTNADTVNNVNAGLGTRGLAGGSVAARMLADRLAANESGLRYQDYNNQQQRMAQAAGMAPSIAAGEFLGYAPALSTASFGSSAPLDAALKQAAGTGGLLGAYQTGTATQKSSPGFLDILGTGLQAASLFSDRRLKTDIRRVGATDEGTPVYTYRYGGEGPFHMGVMADEAPAHALGPVVGGFATVNYGAL